MILPGKKGVVWWVWLYYVVSCCIGGYIDYWKDDAMFFSLYIIISNYLIWYRWLVIISNYLKLDIPPKNFLMKQEHFPRNGYGSIPIDTFLVGWTSIYQLFWGSLGTRVLTHPQIFPFFKKITGADGDHLTSLSQACMRRRHLRGVPGIDPLVVTVTIKP